MSSLPQSLLLRLSLRHPSPWKEERKPGERSTLPWSHAAVQARGWPAGEQLCGGGPGSAGGRQVNHEPVVCPRCQEGQWDPGVH